MDERIRIAFVTTGDPTDRRSWSGIDHSIATALMRHGAEISYLGPLRSKWEIVEERLNRASALFLGRQYDYTHSIVLARRYARLVQHRLAGRAFDVVFAPSASTAIAYLKTSLPIVYLSGTTFRLINGYYPFFSNLLAASVRQSDIVEGRAIKNASLLLYPSEWAARSAREDYGADGGKVHVLPFGANLDEVPSREATLKRRRTDECVLLFLGVDWERKGGDIAVETLSRLKALGVPARLIVCGCVPPEGSASEDITVIPFLDKNDAKQREKLAGLFLAADFLLLPTRSECFGIVFCEASAFGLPIIATDTGGVSAAVRDGENGCLLPSSARGAEFAEVVRLLYQDQRRYEQMVRSGRAAFEDRLNWDTWAEKATGLITDMLRKTRAVPG